MNVTKREENLWKSKGVKIGKGSKRGSGRIWREVIIEEGIICVKRGEKGKVGRGIKSKKVLKRCLKG